MTPDNAPTTRTLTLVVASALFMESLVSTVIATALAAMAADLQVDPLTLKLAFTAYYVALAIFIPVSGWCADRFGARRTLTVQLAVLAAMVVNGVFALVFAGQAGERRALLEQMATIDPLTGAVSNPECPVQVTADNFGSDTLLRRSGDTGHGADERSGWRARPGRGARPRVAVVVVARSPRGDDEGRCHAAARRPGQPCARRLSHGQPDGERPCGPAARGVDRGVDAAGRYALTARVS